MSSWPAWSPLDMATVIHLDGATDLLIAEDSEGTLDDGPRVG